MSNSDVIRLERIRKIYETEDLRTYALSAVDLTIREGEFIAIEGPSGSGKSTLLSILGLLDAPSEGSYHFDGVAVDSLSVDAKADLRNQKIGFIFQSFNLISELTVFENVELPLTYRGLPRATRRDQVNSVLERVGMSHRARHLPAQLSGGQQQRVAVARALAGAPRILLADEPTGNLDTDNGDKVMDLLDELHRDGATLCMVTHNPTYAERAQRTVHLLDGQIVSEKEAA